MGRIFFLIKFNDPRYIGRRTWRSCRRFDRTEAWQLHCWHIRLLSCLEVGDPWCVAVPRFSAKFRCPMYLCGRNGSNPPWHIQAGRHDRSKLCRILRILGFIKGVFLVIQWNSWDKIRDFPAVHSIVADTKWGMIMYETVWIKYHGQIHHIESITFKKHLAWYWSTSVWNDWFWALIILICQEI